uniref:Putative secreted protein n=1 Tax=Anopheles marajoara TaxID=58244 RepID=A0A2M4CB31_9DIPT
MALTVCAMVLLCFVSECLSREASLRDNETIGWLAAGDHETSQACGWLKVKWIMLARTLCIMPIIMFTPLQSCKWWCFRIPYSYNK